MWKASAFACAVLVAVLVQQAAAEQLKVEWTEFPGGWLRGAPVFSQDTGLVYGTVESPQNTYNLYAMRGSSGEVVWRSPGLFDQATLSPDGNTLYTFYVDEVTNCFSIVRAMDSRTGGTKWNSSVIDCKFYPSAFALAFVGETVFVAREYDVFALSATTGAVIWNQTLLPVNGQLIAQLAATSDGKLLVYDGLSIVFALSPTSGETLWQTNVTQAAMSWLSPMMTAADNILYVMSQFGVEIFNTNSGERLFAYQNTNVSFIPGAVNSNNALVMAAVPTPPAVGAPQLFIIDASGKFLVQETLKEINANSVFGDIYGFALSTDGYLFLEWWSQTGPQQQILYVYDLTTNAFVAQFDSMGGAFQASSVGKGGNLFVGQLNSAALTAIVLQ